jgi:hypothetical protein
MCEFWPFRLKRHRLVSLFMHMRAFGLNSERALKGVPLPAPPLGVDFNCFFPGQFAIFCIGWYH